MATSPPGPKDVPQQRPVGGLTLRSGKTRKGSKWVCGALNEAAHAAARSNGTYLAAQYVRLKGSRGPKKRAAVAVGHSILMIAYHLLECK
jgi:transposase